MHGRARAASPTALVRIVPRRLPSVYGCKYPGHRSPDLQDRDMPTVAAPRHHKRRKRKKLKSSFSGRAASRQGPHTSPLASSSSDTRANLPELFALFTMQQEADQDERQRDDSEDPTEPSVSRRPGGTLTTSSGRKPRAKCEARLRYRHRVASGLQAGKRSGESHPKSSLEGERGRLDRVTGVEGSHGSQRCRRAWKARGVCRREGRLAGGGRPAGESAWRVRLGVRLDLLSTSIPLVDWRRGLLGTTEDLCCSILRCTVVLEPRLRLPSFESFHDACHRYLAASTNAIEAPTSRTEICQQSLLLGTNKRRKRKKLKSSFSGRAASRQGPHTSPPASSSSSTRANLPELFALLTMQQEADQDERQRDDSEDPTEPSVSRRRGGPLTTSSGRKPRAECEARLRYRHRVASGLRARKCSGESLPKSSLEGERGRLERVAGVEGSHGSQRCRHAWEGARSLPSGGEAHWRRSTCRRICVAGPSRCSTRPLDHVDSLRGLPVRTSWDDRRPVLVRRLTAQRRRRRRRSKLLEASSRTQPDGRVFCGQFQRHRTVS
ncbi:hypothetical protein MTO96_051609 [Rhipicephalus appendiculatus]